MTVTTASVLSLGMATGAAEASRAADCLWAGASHATGTTIVAGGWEFTCEPGPRWIRGQQTDRSSTVPNPGAEANPAGRFALGARQPGTDYTDYCVGDQLIEGREDIYEVVQDRNGFLHWKAAGPISRWDFDGSEPPPASWRSVGLCRDGELI
ncbi:hypothetical protein [Nocardia brasiliensis]|uniref:hypothetical protein n=1 Tax=Nocardia brasiliensis TaxID=37326 RepID=UPI002454CE83|nr:hypothetical protein [Nocardia brasiliensis]